MANKLCLTHRDRKASSFCHRCHKPICTECTLVTSQGSYCSSECHVIARDFREKMRKEPGQRPTSFLKKAAIGIFVIALIFVIVCFLFGDKLGLPNPLEWFNQMIKKFKNR